MSRYRSWVSLASASEHATILREAGLLTTRRDRNTAIHTITELGRRMLEHQ